jgi:hypothetical protein
MTDKMYNMYGKALINDIKHPLLVCTENIYETIVPLQYDILKDQWLCTWLQENSDIIPIEFGGSCSKNFEYYNYNASKWMRKVASLKHAVENYDWNILVWIDADCSILKVWDSTFVENSFDKDSICFYHQGPKREKFQYGFETGIFGVKREGVHLLLEFFEHYKSKFRNLKRWDDGYVFRHCVKKSNYVTNDLCSNHANLLKPLNFSVWREYVKHNKGTHRDSNVHKI